MLRVDDDAQLYSAYKNDTKSDMLAGAFYSFTSNVDAHFYDKFHAHEIYECHGNIELWQCSNHHWVCEESGIWRAPLEHSFVVNAKTMVAPSTRSMTTGAGEVKSTEGSTTQEDEKDDSSMNEVPRIGHTMGLQRTEPLRNMPAAKDTKGWCQEEGSNWPSCGHCNGRARPAILMFGDSHWQYDRSQHARWDLWREAVWELCENRRNLGGDAEPLKVCILEIGCGMNVPTGRMTSEDMVETIQTKGGEATLVRINPDFPLVSDTSIAQNSIPIKSRGLQAIKQINLVYSTTSTD